MKITTSGDLIRGKTDPREFAAALQNSGKFGISRDGSQVATYVDDVAKTIEGLRGIIARRNT